MFIYTIRASTIKFFAVLCVVVALLIGIVALTTENTVLASSNAEINYGGIRTKEDRIAFIKSFGIEVDESSEKEEKFVLPENFDRVIEGYNQIQLSQGLNLKKYAKKRVMHYSYEAKNVDHDSTVYVNILTYKNRIIACDVSSSEKDGFVKPLVNFSKDMLKL